MLYYRSEAWRLDEEARHTLNRSNVQTLSIITGKTPKDTKTNKRQQANGEPSTWLTGSVTDDYNGLDTFRGYVGPRLKLKKTVFEIFKHLPQGIC